MRTISVRRGIVLALSLAMPLATGGCNHVFEAVDTGKITGESPRDVASSIVRLKARLPAGKRIEFGHAVTTLTLVVPDKQDPRSIGYMTPGFAAMVRGRSVDQIIQLAVLYRASVPRDRGGL